MFQKMQYFRHKQVLDQISKGKSRNQLVKLCILFYRSAFGSLIANPNIWKKMIRGSP